MTAPVPSSWCGGQIQSATARTPGWASPMATPTPAHSTMRRSLPASPQQSTSRRAMPSRRDSHLIAVALSTPAGPISRYSGC